MKNLAVLLVSLAFSANGLAQSPAQEPVQLAQAGGAAQGAALPTTTTSAASATVAVIAAAAAGVAAVIGYNSTTSAHNH